MKRIFSKLATIAFLSVTTLTMAISASAATPDRLQPGEATLAFADSSWIISNWGATTDNEMVVSCLTNTTITGNGEYTVAVDLSSGVFALDDEGNPIVDEETGEEIYYTSVSGVAAMGVMANFPSDDTDYSDLIIDVTSVKFDGTEAKLDGVTSFTNPEDGIFRAQILNQWITPSEDYNSLDMDTASAMLIDYNDSWSKCEVTFTVYGYPTEYEYSEINDETICITGYNGDDTDVVIPAKINGKKVTEIGAGAFQGYPSIKSVIIPDGVTSIGYQAFAFSYALESVTIPDSVTIIGDNAFASCDALTEIIIPDSVTCLGSLAFYSCESLKSITVDSENEIYTSENGVLFNKDMTNLIQYPLAKADADYIIPDSVTTINNRAFFKCALLESVKLPDGVTEIFFDTFLGCSSLKSVELPENLVSIGNGAFASCSSLETITIPDTVTNIGTEAFCWCSSLKSVVIPDGVESIADAAFAGCSSLESVVFSDNVKTIGTYAFSDCVSFKNIVIPDSVTTISDFAFFNCTSLAEATIPKTVTNIGDKAFGYIINSNREEIKIEDFVINCYKDSAAYKYAVDNGFEHKLLDKISTPTAMKGFKLGGRANNALRLNWTKNTSADGYIIEQYNGSKWVRVAKIASNATTTYRVTGLKAGTAYKFRMRAYKMDGTKALYSAYTSTLSARTSPSNVTGFKLGGRAADALRLNWTKNTSADGYIVEQYKSGKWVRIAKITSNATTTYKISGLKASTQYKFRVRAYKMSGKTALYSGYTGTLSAYTNPSKVANLKITGKATTALRLGWSKNTSADGYIIEMYKDGKWVRAAKITSNATVTFRKSGLKKGTTYKFRVRTYNMVGKTALYGNYVNVSGTTNK